MSNLSVSYLICYCSLHLNSVNQFVFVMVKICVFFVVQTEFFNNIYVSFGFRGSTKNVLGCNYFASYIYDTVLPKNMWGLGF
jgi:hypothetical protein